MIRINPLQKKEENDIMKIDIMKIPYYPQQPLKQIQSIRIIHTVIPP